MYDDNGIEMPASEAMARVMLEWNGIVYKEVNTSIKRAAYNRNTSCIVTLDENTPYDIVYGVIENLKQNGYTAYECTVAKNIMHSKYIKIDWSGVDYADCID